MLLNCGARKDSWESLGQQEIKPINPKGNHPEYSLEELMLKLQYFGYLKSQLIGKNPDPGKDWMQKGVTENEVVGWHHQLSGHEFEQTLGDSEGKGSLACCSPWSCKEWDTTYDWTTTQGQVPEKQLIIESTTRLPGRISPPRGQETDGPDTKKPYHPRNTHWNTKLVGLANFELGLDGTIPWSRKW